MKKLISFILLIVAGYIVYQFVIREKPVLEIKADKSISTNYSMDIDAPALSPKKYAAIKGTVKNVSDEVVTNIVLKYKLNTELVIANIDRLEPGEVKSFTTKSIMLKHAEVTFFLEDMKYD